MEKKFKNKSLNKGDHKNAERQASLARGVIALGAIGIALKNIPWKNIKDIVQTCLRKV